ncbi:MAG: O-antigen ligase family protein [Candidatus Coatesbacteria bacterium]|nr:O-antigen ligase family protein [Candidatus Coatesbacteria bacterium]
MSIKEIIRVLLNDATKNETTRFGLALSLLAILAAGFIFPALGCHSISADFSSPSQSDSKVIDVAKGTLRGVSDGVLVIEPDAESAVIEFSWRPGEFSAEWRPIIDLGVSFSDIEKHEVLILWRGQGQQFAPERSVGGTFNLKYAAGLYIRQQLTMNLAGNPNWQGKIAEIKVVLPALSKPVGIDFIRFTDSQLLSLLMPHRKWLGLDKRVFLGYLPALLVLILGAFNVASALRRRDGREAGWPPAGRSADISRKVLFGGLCLVFILNAVFPFDFFPYLKFLLGGVHILLPETLLALLIILLATLQGPKTFRFTPLEWSFIAYLGAALLSLTNARAMDHALLRIVYYLLPPLLFMVLGRGILREENRLTVSRRFTIAVTIAAFWVAFHGMMEGFFDHNYLFDTLYRAFAPIYVEYTFGTPIASSFTDPSVLGSFIVMCIPLALFFARYEKQNRMLRLFGIVSLVVLGFSFAYSCSYGSLVALVVALALYFLRRQKRLIIGLCIAGAVAGIVAAIVVTPQYKQYLADVEEVDRLVREGNLNQDEIVELAGSKLDHTLLYSVNQRVDGAISALRMLRDHPLCGIGIGNFEPYFDDYYQKNPEALRIYKVPDNILFMILAETGILGLLTFLIFVALVVKACLKVLKATSNDPYWNNYAWAVCIAIFGFGVNCLAYDGMFWFSPSFAFWAVLGMFLPLAKRD